MAVINKFPMPIQDPIAKPKRPEYGPKQADPQEGLLGDSWADYMNALQGLQEATPTRIVTLSLGDQGTAITPVDMTDGTLTQGIYRVSYYLCVVDASGVGTQLDVKFSWLDRSISRTWVSVKIDPTVITDFTADSFLLRIDALSPLTYEVEFDGDRFYDLVAVLEEVNA